jgi:hypothetical protein
MWFIGRLKLSDDKREKLLVRLNKILDDLASGTEIKVYRNRAEFDYGELPAYILLDGTEATGTKSTDRRGPQIMMLTPQIFYVPTPTENQLNINMGPQLSAMRVTMIKAIMQDETLTGLLGTNGYAEYRGMETDMQTGAEVKGQFRMDFAFAYVFDFNKL